MDSIPARADHEAPPPALKSFGSLLSESWALFTDRLQALLLIPALFMLVSFLVASVLLGGTAAAAIMAGSMPVYIAGGILVALVFALFAIGALWSQLATLYAIAGEKIGVIAAYKKAWGSLWKFFVIVTFVQFIGAGSFFLFILPAVYYGILFGFSTFIFVTEGTTGGAALKQSRAYVQGRFWSVLGMVVVLPLFVGVALLLLQFILAPLIGKSIASNLFSAVNQLFVAPFTLTYIYVVFKNVRETAVRPTDLGNLRTPVIIASVGTVVGVVLALVLVPIVLTSLNDAQLKSQEGRKQFEEAQALIEAQLNASTTDLTAPEGVEAN